MVNFALFSAGLLALVFGSELLVRGASRLAALLGLSPLVIGLTVVSIGTSAPEIAVSVESAWRGVTDLTVGNVVGRNIFNVLAILGLSALFIPLSVHSQIIRQEIPVLITAAALLLLFGMDGLVAPTEALLLLLGLVVYLVFLVRQARRGGNEHDPLAKKGKWCFLPHLQLRNSPQGQWVSAPIWIQCLGNAAAFSLAPLILWGQCA